MRSFALQWGWGSCLQFGGKRNPVLEVSLDKLNKPPTRNSKFSYIKDSIILSLSREECSWSSMYNNPPMMGYSFSPCSIHIAVCLADSPKTMARGCFWSTCDDGCGKTFVERGQKKKGWEWMGIGKIRRLVDQKIVDQKLRNPQQSTKDGGLYWGSCPENGLTHLFAWI